MALGFSRKKKKDDLEGFELPIFPSSVIGLLTKLRDPGSALDDLAADLEIDPGLHIRVLMLVNSAAFGLSRKVSNVRHAVSLLGRSRLESLVLSVGVKDSLPDIAQLGFDMQQFWSAAVQRATLARELAQELHPNNQSDVFTIGLLQDMAVPVIAKKEGERYQKLYQYWLEQDVELNALEQRDFGTDHAVVGGKMARAWGFPESLITAIGTHHTCDETEALPLSVQIAALIKGQPESDQGEQLAEKASRHFGLDPSLILQPFDRIKKESRELSNALN